MEGFWISPKQAFLMLTVLGIIIYFKRRNKKTKSKMNTFLWVTFITYSAVVISVTLFPVFTGEYVQAMNPSGDYLTVKESSNFIPFKSIIPATQALCSTFVESSSIVEFLQSLEFYNYVKQILGNVLMFLPFGVYLSLLIKQIKFVQVMGIAAISALSIEFIQLIVNMIYGYSYRNANIDDAILNTLGAMIGCLIVVFIGKFKK